MSIIRLVQEVAVHYAVSMSREEAIDMLTDVGIDVPDGLSDDELSKLLAESGNEDDTVGLSLQDYAYETDGGSGQWEAETS